MLTADKKIHIATQAVLYIACCGTHMPVRSRDICAYQGVTLRYLEHILQQLVRDKLLKGVRGPKGGYLLARDRRKISVADIVQSILPLVADDEESANELSQKVTAPLLENLQQQVCQQLAGVTIQDLYDEATSTAVDIVQGEKSDFVI